MTSTLSTEYGSSDMDFSPRSYTSWSSEFDCFGNTKKDCHFAKLQDGRHLQEVMLQSSLEMMTFPQ